MQNGWKALSRHIVVRGGGVQHEVVCSGGPAGCNSMAGTGPATAPAVRWMFEQRLAGHSAARITRALNDAGVPCPSAAEPAPHGCGVETADCCGDSGQPPVHRAAGVEPAAHRLRLGRPGQPRPPGRRCQDRVFLAGQRELHPARARHRLPCPPPGLPAEAGLAGRRWCLSFVMLPARRATILDHLCFTSRRFSGRKALPEAMPRCQCTSGPRPVQT